MSGEVPYLRTVCRYRFGMGLEENLIHNPFAQFEDKADVAIPTATLQIYEAISRELGEKDERNVNRASAANLCVKRRWYQRTGRKGSPLTPRKVVNFLLGDLSERTLLFFIKKGCVGAGKLYSRVHFGSVLGTISFQSRSLEIYQQKTLSSRIGDLEITGHADGFGKRNSDGQWELIEIKSAADYGFDSFKKNGPDSYLKQSHALMMMDQCVQKSVRHVRFFYLRKSTGHVWDRVYEFDEKIALQVRKEFIEASQETMPEDPYGFTEETYRGKPTGRKTVPWMCQYCPYLKECKGEYTLEWKNDQFGQMKPTYIWR